MTLLVILGAAVVAFIGYDRDTRDLAYSTEDSDTDSGVLS